MIAIHPIRLNGAWDIGYAMDKHTLSSKHLGDDPTGKPLFENKRTEIGESLYQFKYNGIKSNCHLIVETMADFLNRYEDMHGFDAIIPVPPTPGKGRDNKPTLEIAKALSEITHIKYYEDILEKTTDQQLKNMSLEDRHLIGRLFIRKKKATRELNVLLVDDLFQTGTTLTHCVNELRKDPMIRKIGVLTVTKTKDQRRYI